MKRILPDPLLFCLAVLASILGIVAIFDAGYARALANGDGPLPREVIMQAVTFGLGIPISFFVATFRPNQWARGAKWLWLITLIALFLVEKIGNVQSGAQRWIGVGPIQVQPAEFAKVFGITFLAATFAGRKPWSEVCKPYKNWADWVDRNSWPKIVRAVPFLTICIAFVLIEKEPDLGTAAVLMVVACLMLIPAGVSRRSLGLLGAIVLCGGLLFATTKAYRMERIANHVHRWDKGRVSDQGYQTTQSEQGQADGGVKGVGIGKGVAKHFLPATMTDFIMATIGEEFGLLGSMGVLALLGGITARLWFLARKAPTEYGALVLYGLAAWIGVQTCTNMMMANGFLPAIGIPLPFFSAGGSAMLAVWVALGAAQGALHEAGVNKVRTKKVKAKTARRRAVSVR